MSESRKNETGPNPSGRDPAATHVDDGEGSPRRAVRHEYTRNWGPILSRLRFSLLVSTYQAGKLAVLSAGGTSESGGLSLAFHNFEKAMGIAASPERLAVGARGVVWYLDSARAIAGRLEPPGVHDACFLTRSARFTGEIQIHELAWQGSELWVVNTLFSCLCTLDDHHSFVPRWWPPFISRLAAEDRCHLNGVAMQGGKARYVTVLGETDTPGGWRPGKAVGGAVLDVDSGEAVLRGLCMPHSPRLYQGKLWLLDSGTGRLVLADLARGAVETVASLPGYARGLALAGPLAFVGLSKIRESSTFGGVPIAEQGEALKSGVAIVELATGRMVGLFEFHSGIDEIFDVQTLEGICSPVISGPYPELDETPPIWLAPSPKSGRTLDTRSDLVT